MIMLGRIADGEDYDDLRIETPDVVRREVFCRVENQAMNARGQGYLWRDESRDSAVLVSSPCPH